MLDKTDREALALALEAYRRRSLRYRLQIAQKLTDESWEEVAAFCSYSEQCTNLGLRPWMEPPVWMYDIEAALALPATADDRGRREAAELLQRMLAAGISRYHPDPRAALAEAEAAKVAEQCGDIPRTGS
jgi:hypothetical protein